MKDIVSTTAALSDLYIGERNTRGKAHEVEVNRALAASSWGSFPAGARIPSGYCCCPPGALRVASEDPACCRAAGSRGPTSSPVPPPSKCEAGRDRDAFDHTPN